MKGAVMSAKHTCAPIPAVLASMFLLGSGACSNCASKEHQAGIDAGLGQDSGMARADNQMDPKEIESRWISNRIMPYYPGRYDFIAATTEQDVKNRFLPAVMVASFPDSTGLGKQCSGALVAPRLVLTAGNCVCSGRYHPAPGGGQHWLIDSTSCATSATIKTIVYGPPLTTGPNRDVTSYYDGEVRPHPSLKIVLDEHGNVVSNEADLAVIAIAGSPVDRFPPLALADGDLRVNEPLIMLGYDTPSGPGERRFGQYHVTKILDAGARALFDQPGHNVFKGDSGGPCIRETDHGMVLAGILNRSLGAEASFTSTFHYRDWIRQEIQRAASDSPSPY